MLGLTDAISQWSDDLRHAEFRERAFINSVLAVQHPGGPGMYLYSHPLSAGSRKVYGDGEQTFWCCYGTSVEAYGRPGDGIYFITTDSLHVRQFVASEATWSERGVHLVQDTKFPYEPRTRLTIHVDKPVEFALVVRVPKWANGATCNLNGEKIGHTGSQPMLLHRIWSDGDVVTLTLPMTMRVEQLPGDPTHYAFVYGPTVLAARAPHAPELGVVGSKAAALVRPVNPSKLHFTVPLVSGHFVDLVPVNEIVDEPFGVYFKTPVES